MSEWKDVAKVSDFPKGSRVLVKHSPFDIIVFNLEGEFFAIEDVCTHDGESLDGGDLEGEEIICPRHGAQFEIKTGKVTVLPATEDLQTFPTRIKDGKVQVQVLMD